MTKQNHFVNLIDIFQCFFGEKKNKTKQAKPKASYRNKNIVFHSAPTFLSLDSYVFVEYFVCAWHWVEHCDI